MERRLEMVRRKQSTIEGQDKEGRDGSGKGKGEI